MPNNILDSFQISGSVYDLKDKNSPSITELTQQEYDNLPSSAKTSNTLFLITDATPIDVSNYYTKSETSGATQISTALNAKADTATTYTKTEVDNAITAGTSTKQDTLVSGTNIKTINNESILGSGNIDIQGGGMDDNTQQLIATSLVDLNDRKADKSLLENYQKKGDYATKSELDAKANVSDVMTLEKSTNNELVTATALNNLNHKFGGLSLVKITESAYAALTTKDENILYIVVADPS